MQVKAETYTVIEAEMKIRYSYIAFFLQKHFYGI